MNLYDIAEISYKNGFEDGRNSIHIVYCKSCKHGQHMMGSETYMCHSPRYDDYMFHHANHYCGYGERKESI